MAKLSRKLRQDSTARYATKLYTWRSLGGIIPEDMAVKTVNDITQQWEQENAKMSAVRQSTISILKDMGVDTVKYITYIAYAEQLAHDIYKCYNSASDANECIANMIQFENTKYANAYGADANILARISVQVNSIMAGGQ